MLLRIDVIILLKFIHGTNMVQLIYGTYLFHVNVTIYIDTYVPLKLTILVHTRSILKLIIFTKLIYPHQYNTKEIKCISFVKCYV